MEDKLLDDCSYEILYDSSTSNIAGVVCLNESESSNSSNVLVIGGLPFIVNSQVKSIYSMHKMVTVLVLHF